MTVKAATKIAFITCLLSLICVPIVVWTVTGRSLSDVATFVAASAAPLGVLTGAMAYRGAQRDRSKQTEISR